MATRATAGGFRAVNRCTTFMPHADWRRKLDEHEKSVDDLTAGRRRRVASGQHHVVEDFLYEYYGLRPGALRRWHPGLGVALESEDVRLPPHASWNGYVRDSEGHVLFDHVAFLARRADTVAFIRQLLEATNARASSLGCFGLHEWAMVYGGVARRHDAPLRLGREGTDRVVETHALRCTHFDAFRFFAPRAAPRNATQLARTDQVEREQPGCLHAGMDTLKWALKLGPAVSGDLLLDCFRLAADARRLDMEASPYDLSAEGLTAVPVETSAGKAEYTRRQRAMAERSIDLRERLLAVCRLLEP